MTVEMFIYLLTIGSVFASLLTQATKKAFANVSSNVLALVDAIVVGIVGTSCTYVILEIPFTPSNIIYIAFMAVCIWIGSMVGYDKIIQTIKQIRG